MNNRSAPIHRPIRDGAATARQITWAICMISAFLSFLATFFLVGFGILPWPNFLVMLVVLFFTGVLSPR